MSESAIAAGIRRIEAVAGDAARAWAEKESAHQHEKFEMLTRKKPDIAALPIFAGNAETSELLKQIDARAAHLEKLEAEVHDWENELPKLQNYRRLVRNCERTRGVMGKRFMRI